jgi:site-specific DNA-methyltransferase (adenine-specific)
VEPNVLYYGDNLEVLREHFPDRSVDLVYLDPPYGRGSDLRIVHPEQLGKAVDGRSLVVTPRPEGASPIALRASLDPKIEATLSALRVITSNDRLVRYLGELAARLVEVRRVLRATGSVVVRSDPVIGPYVRLLLDSTLGVEHYVDEIIWVHGRSTQGSFRMRSHLRRAHDVFIHYKLDRRTAGRASDPELDRLSDVWEDIPGSLSRSPERLGFATQQPESLVERIVSLTTAPGDLVLDPFTGTGTTLVAAERLNRQWVGIEFSALAIAVARGRLKRDLGLDVPVIGWPSNLADLRSVAASAGGYDQFVGWVLAMLGGQPTRTTASEVGGGVDGVITFEDAGGKRQQALVEVKVGTAAVGALKTVIAAMERDHAPIGILVTTETPSTALLREASAAGWYHSKLWDRDYPRVQVLDLADVLGGKTPKLPPSPPRRRISAGANA